MSLLYAIVFVSFTIGFGLSISQWVTLLALVALAATFMTGLGLLVSLYFHSISDWFLPGITILVVLMLPQISFGAPAFSPAWLRFIPTTPVLFAFRDALYGSSEGGSMLSTAALLAAFAAAAVGAAYAGVRFKLLRETRS
jgi:ABC-2 type transport system permease protein/fluoroquinolone transport system permease protein